MKTLKTLTLLLVIAMISASCSKTNTDDPTPGKTDDILKQGEWTVSLFSERGEDKTHKFSGYTVTFKQDGTLQINSSKAAFTGTWTYHSSDNGYGTVQKLIISITGNTVVDELDDDWVIIEMNDNLIRLKDDNPDKKEFLNFSKK